MIALTNEAKFICPHGFELIFDPESKIFINTGQPAQGIYLTLSDFKRATIQCTNPPTSGGPCTQIIAAIDPFGARITMNGYSIVTDQIKAMTDKGLVTLVSPFHKNVRIEPSEFALNKNVLLESIKKQLAENEKKGDKRENEIKKENFLEIELVDESGNPVPEEEYLIHFPDDEKVIKGKLGKTGTKKIEIDSDNVTNLRIEFPNRGTVDKFV